MKATPVRCPWPTNEISIRYHDTEWGVPVHDDRLLFEYLILEGAQAGLSWQTVLNKRENYRAAFDNFEAEKIARYGLSSYLAVQSNHVSPNTSRSKRVIHIAIDKRCPTTNDKYILTNDKH